MLLDEKSIGRRSFFIGWAVWLLVALIIDGPVARLLAPLHPIIKKSVIAEEVREGGHFALTLIIAVLLGVLHRDRWRAATLVVMTAGITGLARNVIAFVVG